MHKHLAILSLALLAGCASKGMVFHSPYDLDRDGVMDARCPGLEYDTSGNTLYGWRSHGSAECEERAPASAES